MASTASWLRTGSSLATAALVCGGQRRASFVQHRLLPKSVVRSASSLMSMSSDGVPLPGQDNKKGEMRTRAEFGKGVGMKRMCQRADQPPSEVSRPSVEARGRLRIGGPPECRQPDPRGERGATIGRRIPRGGGPPPTPTQTRNGEQKSSPRDGNGESNVGVCIQFPLSSLDIGLLHWEGRGSGPPPGM